MILSKIVKTSNDSPKGSVSHLKKLLRLSELLNKLKSAKLAHTIIKKEELNSVYRKFNAIKNTENARRKQKGAPLINYIINVTLSQTNTIVNVTDVAGNPKISISAGLVNLTKRQKKKQPMALVNIFKVLLLKVGFLRNTPVAIHFKNTKAFYQSFLIKALKDKLFIKSIQSYNLSPHNGCRPKKLKRIKRRTKRMVLR